MLRITLSGVCCGMQELDRWEERLEELFAGRPYDIYDAALTATISDFPVSIQPFRDMVGIASSQPPVEWLDRPGASAAIYQAGAPLAALALRAPAAKSGMR